MPADRNLFSAARPALWGHIVRPWLGEFGRQIHRGLRGRRDLFACRERFHRGPRTCLRDDCRGRRNLRSRRTYRGHVCRAPCRAEFLGLARAKRRLSPGPRQGLLHERQKLAQRTQRNGFEDTERETSVAPVPFWAALSFYSWPST